MSYIIVKTKTFFILDQRKEIAETCSISENKKGENKI